MTLISTRVMVALLGLLFVAALRQHSNHHQAERQVRPRPREPGQRPEAERDGQRNGSHPRRPCPVRGFQGAQEPGGSRSLPALAGSRWLLGAGPVATSWTDDGVIEADELLQPASGIQPEAVRRT